jgi:hypothetical protein
MSVSTSKMCLPPQYRLLHARLVTSVPDASHLLSMSF